MRKIYELIIKMFSGLIFVNSCRREFRSFCLENKCYRNLIKSRKMQNEILREKLKDVENLVVYLTIAEDSICGGVIAIFKMAQTSRTFKNIHDSEVIVMTNPNKNNNTYCKQTHFKNEEMIYRFSQITELKNLKKLIINIPEISVVHFCKKLTYKQKIYLQNIKDLQINIMNQNILLMPSPDEFKGLYNLTNNITQTLAHSKYTTQEIADKYQLKSLLMPGWTDLNCHVRTNYKDKDNIIAYSNDLSPIKETVISILKKRFPDFEFFEVQGLSFDEYINFVTRAKFTVSFGEGFDGYLIWPIRQGSLGFAVYNDEFFPALTLKDYENICQSGEDMIKNIADVMESLNNNPQQYDELNAKFNAELDKYPEARANDYEFHAGRIKRFYLNDFDFYPKKEKILESVRGLKPDYKICNNKKNKDFNK